MGIGSEVPGPAGFGGPRQSSKVTPVENPDGTRFNGVGRSEDGKVRK